MTLVSSARANDVFAEHRMTLLEELQARIQAKNVSIRLPVSLTEPIATQNELSTDLSLDIQHHKKTHLGEAPETV